MQIKTLDNNTLEISGNIKSLEDYAEIKSASQALISRGAKEITFNMTESLSMVSSVIGYLIKLINVEHVKVRVNVRDERLYNLLDQLNLIQLFNVHMY